MSISAIALLGAPGVGKGTIAAGIESSTGFVHVSTGNLLRDAVREKTEVGGKAEAYMKRGDLVPDDLILSIVMSRIACGPADARYMFDGFPRTLAQARMLTAMFDERGAELLAVFLLEAPQEVILERLGGRRICRNCGANFHVRNIPPRREGVCDHCGGELYRRPDDAEATILNRLAVFRDQSADLLSYYKDLGILVRVDASRHRDEVVAGILNILSRKKIRMRTSTKHEKQRRDHNKEQ